MIKNESTRMKRAAYVKQRLADVRNKRTEIKRLATELFLSESTIWNDYNY